MGQRSAASAESKGFEYSRWQLVLKRLLDIVVAAILLVFLSPLWHGDCPVDSLGFTGTGNIYANPRGTSG